jgi:hypothetical protein
LLRNDVGFRPQNWASADWLRRRLSPPAPTR